MSITTTSVWANEADISAVPGPPIGRPRPPSWSPNPIPSGYSNSSP